MKELLFICDFDGTITEKDFYKTIIEKYMYEPGNAKLKQLRNNEITIIQFLEYIFNNINQEEDIIQKEIRNMDIRPGFFEFVKYVQSIGGEIVILSAGFDYYIKEFLEYNNLTNIMVYANKSIYKNKGLHRLVDEKYIYHCNDHGINKKKVVSILREHYKIVCYAGDGYPDFEAAKLTDRIFSTSRLSELCEENDIKHIPFRDFFDIKSQVEREVNAYNN